MKNILLTVVGIAFIVLSFIFFLRNPAHPASIPLGTRVVNVKFSDIEVKANLSDTPTSREQGLSGRKGLSPNTGMLFVFDAPGLYGFWMKDMLFSIDIVGMDDQKQVVWLEENLSPATYPAVFTPKNPVKYVLELPSGFIAAHMVDMGQILSFEP